MPNKGLLFVFIFGLHLVGLAQQTKDSTVVTKPEDLNINTNATVREAIDPLAPSKAAFYSAILPGLGQAYNKKYWKIPIVYAALGTGIYFYIDNNNELNRYRDAFKRRLAGFTDDEFYGNGPTPLISNDGLIRAQRQFRRNKDISLLVTVGLYALNIIDANVDAHLLQYNVDENLSLRPHIRYNQLESASDLGLTLNFKF